MSVEKLTQEEVSKLFNAVQERDAQALLQDNKDLLEALAVARYAINKIALLKTDG